MTTLSPPPLDEPGLDEFQRETILQLATDGFNRSDMARIVGCEPSVIASAVQQDRKFRVDLALAEDALRRNAIQTLNRVVVQDKYWRAAGWVAERLMPEKFGRRRLEPLSAAEVQEASGEMGSVLLETAPAPAASEAAASPTPASKAKEISTPAPAEPKTDSTPPSVWPKTAPCNTPFERGVFHVRRCSSKSLCSTEVPLCSIFPSGRQTSWGVARTSRLPRSRPHRAPSARLSPTARSGEQSDPINPVSWAGIPSVLDLHHAERVRSLRCPREQRRRKKLRRSTHPRPLQ